MGEQRAVRVHEYVPQFRMSETQSGGSKVSRGTPLGIAKAFTWNQTSPDDENTVRRSQWTNRVRGVLAFSRCMLRGCCILRRRHNPKRMPWPAGHRPPKNSQATKGSYEKGDATRAEGAEHDGWQAVFWFLF